MKTFQVSPNLFYVNDSVHWFGPFNNKKELDLFFSDSMEEQWFAAVRDTKLHQQLNKMKQGK